MTVNYFLKCSVCDKITHMRSPAGYIEKTPVRIHCGNCNTLLTGHLISDNEHGHCYFESINCEEVERQECEFYGEAAGEILCNKLRKKEKPDFPFLPPTISPALRVMNEVNTETLEHYIDYACHISDYKNNWDTKRILYDLYIQSKFELFREKYYEDAKQVNYPLESDYDVHRYLHYQYVYDFGGVFGKDSLIKLLTKLNYEFIHLDNQKLSIYEDYLRTQTRIKSAQAKTFSIMNDYVNIALNTLPALCATLYLEDCAVDKNIRGISTCSFEDIKGFYVDTFESLAGFADIIICLDNIKYRDGYDDFGNEISLSQLEKMSKGNKIGLLNGTEFFAGCFALESGSNQLRNAIGHNDYTYDGLTQTIKYMPDASRPNNIKEMYLLDVAIKCINLMRSSMILEFILYLLTRNSFHPSNTPLAFHPLLYKSTQSSSRCPCGSNKKYNKCCKEWVKSNSSLRGFDLPSKSNMTWQPMQSI